MTNKVRRAFISVAAACRCRAFVALDRFDELRRGLLRLCASMRGRERYNQIVQGQLPLVSVVITCYNYGAYLRECVLSVATQTYSNLEIIIVDDGSTDDSLQVATRCKEETLKCPIKIISQANSGQPAIARNVGIRSSAGTFILPLDADDRITPNYVANAVGLFLENPEVDIVYCDSRFIGATGQSIYRTGPFRVSILAKANSLVYCNMYRRVLWAQVGGYRENVRGYEDWDFWLAAALCGAKALHLEGVGLIYTDKSGGVYSQTLPLHEKRVAQVRLNNMGAFSRVEISQARKLLGCSD